MEANERKESAIVSPLSLSLLRPVRRPEQTRGRAERVEERHHAQARAQPGLEQHGHSAGQHRYYRLLSKCNEKKPKYFKEPDEYK